MTNNIDENLQEQDSGLPQKQKTIVPKHKFYITLFLCWIVYMTAYLCRVNLSISLPFMEAEYGWGRASLGGIASGFFIAYAIGQLVNGIIGDKYNPKYFVTIGIVAASICNILMTFSSNYYIIVVLWTLNGFFQSMLWGPIVRTASLVTAEEDIIKVGTFLSTSPIIGSFLSYNIMGGIVAYSWKLAFFVPGIIFIVAGAIWFISIRFEKPVSEKAEDSAKQNAPKPESFVKFMLRNGMIVLTLGCILHGIVKESISIWLPTMITETQSITMNSALFYVSFVPIVNFISTLLAGWMSKKTNSNYKANLIFWFLLSAALSLLLYKIMGMNIITTVLCIALISASIFAINSIYLSFIPLNYHKENRVSGVAGLLDFSTYAGAALSGPLVGILSVGNNWNTVALMWFAASVLGALMLFLSGRRNKNHSI